MLKALRCLPLLLLGCQASVDTSVGHAVAAAAPLAPAAPTAGSLEPSPPPVRTLTGTRAVAFFAGENLDYCISSTVSLQTPANWQPPPNALALQQAPWAFIDDGYIALRNGKAALTMPNGGEMVALQLQGLLTYDPTQMAASAKLYREAAPPNEKRKKRTAETSNPSMEKVMDELVAGITWPMPSVKRDVESGAAITVDSCAFPNRVPLATCSVTAETDATATPRTTLHLLFVYYGVGKAHDSDTALRTCLRMHGQWEAADRDDHQVARERLRQHAARLGELSKELQ